MSRPFDEAKYQALSEGLEFSEVGWSSMNEDIRFDAEYFRKRFLREETNLRKFRRHTLAEVAFVSDGQHGYFETDAASPIHMLAARNAKQWFADQEDAVPIAKWVDDKNQRSSLRVNDIILSTRGTVGCCAIVGKDVLPANINQDVARLAIQHPDFLPEFVLAYLNSSYGQDWLQRNQTGMVQQGVCLQKLRNMPIPCLSSDFQSSIATHLHKTRDIIDASHATISSAETLLLAALGLENWQPGTPLSYTQSSQDVFGSMRLDSEYFYPKFSELREKLATGFQLKTLGEAGKVLKGRSVSYSEDGAIPIIRSGNLNDISDDTRFLRSSDVADVFRLQRGDVLISSIGFGSIGKVQVFDREGIYGTVSEVTVVRQKTFNPYYLAAYLRSLAGQMQIERYITGATGQLHLYPKDVARIYVPVISEVEQVRFESLAQEASASKREATRLLALAKTAVETAIEQGEDAGMRLLEGEKTFV